ncbi:hypothetical protein K4F52_005025 [Lecanicillium sp. MT-2017a]|nr:hypothetical protein K4F52_005025 [Lecanicillium sp. MT-2017a]
MTLQASLSNIEIEFIDGVLGEDVSDKAIPTDGEHERLGDASIGSWRAHLNAVREIVSRNLSSALIFEDDVDWDIRIRDQLQDFARSSRALIQPLADHSGSYADPTYPEAPADTETGPTEFKLDYLRPTTNPTLSPYGDDWDVLWLGHCGMHFPFAKNAIPKGRVVHENDDTVAEKKHLWTFNKPFTLKEDYAEHTRVVHHSQEGVCSLGYAVSQRGARRLLHEVALKDMSDAYDILLRFFCEGTHGRRRATCLTTQPALFHHHRPVGPNSAASDIGNHGEGFHATASTDMLRWSVRLNAEALLDGRTDYVDQFGKTE